MRKQFLLLGPVLVLLYLPFFMAWGLGYMFTNIPPKYIIIAHIVLFISNINLLISYVKDIQKNNSLSSDKKLLYVLLLFIFSPVFMLYYYYAHLRMSSSNM